MKQTRRNTSSCRRWVPLAKMSDNWVVDMKSTHTASWDMSKILCKQCREYQMLPPCQASFYRALETDGKQTTWNCHHGLQCIKQEKCIKSIYKGQFKGQAFQRRTYTVSKVSKTTAARTGRCSLKTWMQKAHCVYIYISLSQAPAQEDTELQIKRTTPSISSNTQETRIRRPYKGKDTGRIIKTRFP